MAMRAASGGHGRPDRREPPHVAAILARCGSQQAPDADVSDWHPNPALLMVGSLVYDTVVALVGIIETGFPIPVINSSDRWGLDRVAATGRTRGRIRNANGSRDSWPESRHQGSSLACSLAWRRGSWLGGVGGDQPVEPPHLFVART